MISIEDYLYKGLSLYQRIPTYISMPLGTIYKNIPLSVRYGKLYGDYQKLIRESEYWDNEQVETFTINRLRDTLINAFENSIYYKNLFISARFDPFSFNDFSSFNNIPFSDKSVLRNSKEDVLNRKYKPGQLLYVTTGGTSGIPVEIYFVKGRERTRELVFMTDLWKRVGFKYGDRIARIRGTVVDYKGNNTYFRYEPVKNRLFLSTYDMFEENLPKYIYQLIKFKPHFIHTYPSAIIPLAKFIKKQPVKFKGLKAVLCSSEQLYPGQREFIEEVFGCRVYSWYGHTESTTLAGECECSHYYHVYFQYGYTELIDENGKPVTRPGIIGEITGTSFEMKAFPIIRYRTGDYAEWVKGKCICGRNYKLMNNVTGRWIQEQIVTLKDSLISVTALNMHSDIFDNVIQFQFYQKEKGKVTLRIVRSKIYSCEDERKIIKRFNEKFKDLVNFDIQYVDTISRTERGKHKFLISELSEQCNSLPNN